MNRLLGSFLRGHCHLAVVVARLATVDDEMCIRDSLSPISDTTIMASAGAHCFHLNHVATQLPYGITVAAVSFVSFIIAGLVQSAVVCMIIAIVLMVATLLVIKACLLYTSRKT